MLLLPLLLAAHPLQAQECGVGNVALVHDLSQVAFTEWSGQVDELLSALYSGQDTAATKEAVNALAEEVGKAEEEGRLDAEDSAKLQDALSYLWHRADELEKGWQAVAEGRFGDARTQANQLADRVRETSESGMLCEEEKDGLVAAAWRLWNIADGLSKTEGLFAAGDRQGAMDKANEVAELAKEYLGYGQISEAQQQAAQTQAQRLHEEASKLSEQSAVSRTPYYNQYDNRIDGGGSCQNTSVAMALGSYGVTVTPDTISSRFGTDKAKTPSGVAEVFNAYASEAGIPQRMRGHYDGTFEGMKQLLDEGKPVIIHGYFTAGHVVVVTGYDETGYFVNDPAGVWAETWKGGYHGSYDGERVHYGKAAFEQAVGTWDGSTPAPLYYAEVYTP